MRRLLRRGSRPCSMRLMVAHHSLRGSCETCCRELLTTPVAQQRRGMILMRRECRSQHRDTRLDVTQHTPGPREEHQALRAEHRTETENGRTVRAYISSKAVDAAGTARCMRRTGARARKQQASGLAVPSLIGSQSMSTGGLSRTCEVYNLYRAGWGGVFSPRSSAPTAHATHVTANVPRTATGTGRTRAIISYLAEGSPEIGASVGKRYLPEAPKSGLRQVRDIFSCNNCMIASSIKPRSRVRLAIQFVMKQGASSVFTRSFPLA